MAANRLYYAAYYVSSALLVSAGHVAKTHEGTIGIIGQHYVRTGILTNEDGSLLASLPNVYLPLSFWKVILNAAEG